MANGIIIKGIGGFYYVKDGLDIVTCKARGIFRNLDTSPVIGDYVEYEKISEGDGRITKLLPRKNCLIRPTVANIELLGIVIAASNPQPDWLLADKLLIQSQRAKIEPILILNKMDECNDAVLAQFESDYRCFKRYPVSAVSGEGIAALSAALKDKICCFAGQSAVGKTSIINMLLPELKMEIGELSKKTQRGRHTTRAASLIPFNGGALLDTPGFSLLESEFLEKSELMSCYPEFATATPCRFSDCSHISEPDCGVKDLLTWNKMSFPRYERYVTMYKENENRRKHLHD